MRPRVVAIDGPSGSGKSTTARAVAETLGLEVLDTGAMYRAVAYAAIRANVRTGDEAGLARLAATASIEIESDRVTLDGRDVTAEIRSPSVTEAVSEVAAHRRVRDVLVARQRAWVDGHGGGVVEGRDIGTVVFPDAAVKAYLVASEDVRARRRQHDEEMLDRQVGVDDVRNSLVRRDEADSSREDSPLQAAEDAVVIDTSARGVAAVVQEIVDAYRSKEAE